MSGSNHAYRASEKGLKKDLAVVTVLLWELKDAARKFYISQLMAAYNSSFVPCFNVGNGGLVSFVDIVEKCQDFSDNRIGNAIAIVQKLQGIPATVSEIDSSTEDEVDKDDISEEENITEE
ncbi:hypothetical protein LTR56_000784 [Elasticomyces elasticus]|nr:hypothetical protein LTR22_009060 [Elasticomyces elasticus]KAK3660408.1 hypothetical protein LTR56_000784 [Elasticomyces elasticus]KAK4929201.1 hypothetical protein LTR49_004098 [Elasticomyces elasticus]KAK5765757.1 hypothetical protein LTS12_004017 [Elasticomyces elasticus]